MALDLQITQRLELQQGAAAVAAVVRKEEQAAQAQTVQVLAQAAVLRVFQFMQLPTKAAAVEVHLTAHHLQDKLHNLELTAEAEL